MDSRRASTSGAGLGAADERSVASTERSYQQIPYRTSPWSSAQPARLETIARLHGLDAAPADDCRVLELGCGDGGNLIPLAVAHPRARFVGVDLAKVHVDAADALVRELALANVRFESASFVDWGEDEHPFDYVIVHGLMSWVTPPLQDRLFATCARLLAPRGVAFVSFNTRPGWALQHAIREMLRLHNRGVDDLAQSVARSRALLEVLSQTIPGRESAWREHVASVSAIASNPAREYYFAHEYLEDENHPFFVADFVARASDAGLGYLADADLIDCELDNMPDEPRERLGGLARDRAERIQTLDLAVNRKFRQALLVHTGTPLDEQPVLSRLRPMYVTTNLKSEADASAVASDACMTFADRLGRTLELDQPLAKAAMARFVEVSPQPIALPELLAWARTRTGDVTTPDEAALELLAVVFGRLFTAGLAEVRTSPPCWALAAGERPVASPLVRRAARLGGDRLSTLRHTSIALDHDDVRAVLERLDGRLDRAALAAELAGRVEPDAIETILGLAAEKGLLLP